MKHTSSQLKQMARANLYNKWPIAIGLTAIHTLMIYLLNMCTSLFQSNDTKGIVVQLAVRLIISMISSLFTVGSYFFYLNICRGRTYNTNNLFAAFKMNPDRFLVVSLIVQLPVILLQIPTISAPLAVTVGDALHLSIHAAGYSILAYFISVIFSMFFELAYFLMLDFQEMEALPAMKISAALMRGNKLRYFYIMVLSFIGWHILGTFSFELGYFWITPYITMTMTYFYCDVLEQLKHSPYMQGYTVPEFLVPAENTEGTFAAEKPEADETAPFDSEYSNTEE